VPLKDTIILANESKNAWEIVFGRNEGKVIGILASQVVDLKVICLGLRSFGCWVGRKGVCDSMYGCRPKVKNRASRSGIAILARQESSSAAGGEVLRMTGPERSDHLVAEKNQENQNRRWYLRFDFGL
jgi:hypothetical protein